MRKLRDVLLCAVAVVCFYGIMVGVGALVYGGSESDLTSPLPIQIDAPDCTIALGAVDANCPIWGCEPNTLCVLCDPNQNDFLVFSDETVSDFTIEYATVLLFTEYAEPMLTFHITSGGHSMNTADTRWRRVIFLDANAAVIGDFTRQ